MKDASVQVKNDVVLKEEKFVQEQIEDVLEQEMNFESEETLEIGEQFSLEDFGIS